MVEQFNLRTSRHVPTESPLATPNVTISGPIIEDEEIPLNGHIIVSTEETRKSQSDISSPPPPTTSAAADEFWKTSPLFNPDSSEDEEDEVEDVFKTLSYGALPNSDTMSSDMIVNSISNGKCNLPLNSGQ